MKKSAMLCIGFVLSLAACKKDSGEDPTTDPPDLDTHSVKVFKNISGDPAFNGLQAHIHNDQYKYALDMYGTFNAENNPLQIRTISYKKDNNDTTVFLTFNILSNKLETMFTEVKGVRQTIVLKNEYIPGSDTSLTLSVYNYSWSAQTGKMLFQTLLTGRSQSPMYMSNARYDFNDILFGLKAGLTVVGIIYTVQNAGAIAAAVIEAAPAILLMAAATGAIILAIEFLSRADAATREPGSGPFPANTPAQNPARGDRDPAGKLPPSPCGSTHIRFSASKDGSGNILISAVGGGTPPYRYAVGNLDFKDDQIFINPDPATSKLIFVKDATGCISGRIVNFDDPVIPAGWYKAAYTLHSTYPKNICPSDSGKSGSFYVYVTPAYWASVYFRSLFKEIPDTAVLAIVDIRKNDVTGELNYHIGTNTISVYNEYDLRSTFRLNAFKISPAGIISTDGPDGRGSALSYAPRNEGCQGFLHGYTMTHSGNLYDVQTPPSELSEKEVKTILKVVSR